MGTREGTSWASTQHIWVTVTVSKLRFGKVGLWNAGKALDPSKFSVAKLTDHIYQSWKFKMKMLLIREGTWSYTQEAKLEKLSNAWIAGDQQAQSTICLSIQDSQIVQICNSETTKKMWDEQKRYTRGPIWVTSCTFWGNSDQSRLGKSQGMKDYIQCNLEMVEQLQGIGEDIAHFQVATLLSNGLPDSYEMLITVLHACPYDELTCQGQACWQKEKQIYVSGNEGGTQSALCTEAQECVDSAKHGIQHETRECFLCIHRGQVKKGCFAWKVRKEKLRAGVQSRRPKVLRCLKMEVLHLSKWLLSQLNNMLYSRSDECGGKAKKLHGAFWLVLSKFKWLTPA